MKKGADGFVSASNIGQTLPSGTFFLLTLSPTGLRPVLSRRSFASPYCHLFRCCNSIGLMSGVRVAFRQL
jgi:hypothetical protein